MDVDDFKALNDTYGHNSGDTVLKNIAANMLDVSNEWLKICRSGGEEFVCMVTGANASEYLTSQLEQLRHAIARMPMNLQNQEMYVTVTIGTAQYHPKDESYHEILKRADEALYEGKKQGKNVWCADEQENIDYR